MEENSDNQMETDVSSTTQDLPAAHDVSVARMEVSVEIAETTVEVEEVLEEPQDQSIDSNTPEVETPPLTVTIVSPSKPAAVERTPEKAPVNKSPLKPSNLPKSPEPKKSLVLLQGSPIKLVSIEKSPVKVVSSEGPSVESVSKEKSVASPPKTPVKEDHNEKSEDSKNDNKLESAIPPTEIESTEKVEAVTKEASADSGELSESNRISISTPSSEVSEKEHNKSISRELKSLINSAKESKIISECTQLTSKTRKSRSNLDSSLNSSDAKKVTPRRGSDNSQESNSSERSEKSAQKRSMRSQNPEFVTKQKTFLNSLKKTDDASIDESDDTKNVETEISPKKKSLDDKQFPIPVSTSKLRQDAHCWRCHWPVDTNSNEKSPKPVTCTVCPRSYHFKCLTTTERSYVNTIKNWVCPECHHILQAESSETRSPAMRKITLGMLCDLLKYALKRMMEVNGVEPFLNPVDRTAFPEYDKFVVYPMDLSMIRANIAAQHYGSTEAFASDVQWILHNSIIFNTLQSKLTAAARALHRSCKAEMGEIEACPECYAAAHARRPTWFTDVCSTPHILLWAKLKGFPYWPAKGMSVSGAGMVDVRFFGAHDRAWVPARDCFLYSEKDPNNFRTKRQDIIDSMQEAEEHIRSISRKFGKFVYPAYKVPLEPAQINEQLTMMIPGYTPSSPPAAKAREPDATPASLKNKRKSMSKADSESAIEETPKAKRKITEKSDKEQSEENATGEEDKTKKCNDAEKQSTDKESEASRKRRRSAVDDSSGNAADAEQAEKRLRLDPSAAADKNKDTANQPKDVNVTKEGATETASTPKTKDKPKTPKPRGSSTPKIVLRQVPNNKTPKSNEKPKAKARKKSNSSEKSDDKSKNKTRTKNKSNEETDRSETDKASPLTRLNKPELVKTANNKTVSNSPKSKEADDTFIATTVKKNKAGALNIPLLISNVRSLSKPNTSPMGKAAEGAENTNSIFTPTSTDNVSNMKDAVAKLQKLKNNGSEQSLVGRVGVKAFARMTSPNVDAAAEKVVVEVKAEPIDLDDAERQSEKIDLLNSFRLRPVNPTSLRDIRISKVSSAPTATAAVRKPAPKLVELRPKAKKTFPTPRKPDEGRSELNGKNSMVYIPIQPPMTQAPRPPAPRLNGPANVSPLRQISPIVSSAANNIVNTSPLMNNVVSSPPAPVVPPVPQVGPVGPLGPGPALGPVPTVGQVPSSVHTMPFITSVNGQWRFSLQPVMAVGVQDATSPPQVNGIDHPVILPQPMNPPPLVASSEPPLLTPTVTTANAAGVLPNATESGSPGNVGIGEITRPQKPVNPLDPAAPPGDVPTPSHAGPVTAKINQNAAKLTDFFRNLLEESLEQVKNPAAQLTAARKQIEALQWKFQQQLKEIKHSHDLQLSEMRTSFEKEKARAAAEAARAAKAELEVAVKHAKSRQWCAYCYQEASLKCCWNTSYCGYPCQCAHWPKHFAACAQNRSEDGTCRKIGAGERLQPPELQEAPASSTVTVGGKVLPPRVAPPLAPAKPAASIIVSLEEDTGGNPTIKCLGTYNKQPNSSPLLINKQLMNNEENAQKKVVTSGGYLIVGAGAPAAGGGAGPVVID